MSGITEILLIVAIVVAIVFLPRLASRKTGAGKPHAARKDRTLSGAMRLAVLLSLVWPAGCAFIMEPWGRGLGPFLYLGVAPVALLWAGIWVIKGFRGAKR